MKKFPVVLQHDAMDCGPACLAMIAEFYGKKYPLQSLRDGSYLSKTGVSMMGLSTAAESIGFRTLGIRIEYDLLSSEVNLPCIIYWKQRHFMVVHRIRNDRVYVADPAHGLAMFKREEFLKGWINTQKQDEDQGLVLMLEPTPEFYVKDTGSYDKTRFRFLFSYLRPYKKFMIQLLLGLFLGSLLNLMFPFLTQAIVDKGIKNHDIGFIYLVLAAQLMLFCSITAIEFIRSWILLHISTRINIHLISDFLVKLLKLSIGFFDTKMIGDILQRIDDHERIESFLTTSTLSILFSTFNLIVFGVVLAVYHYHLFLIYCLASLLYVLWIVLFMKRRRMLDYKRFTQLSDSQSSLIQLISGIQEIKLNNCEQQKRWNWEQIQAKLFKINVKGLALKQYQQSGAVFINQLKNIFISFYAAKAVIQGELTLGMMLAIHYIIGQLNSPIDQLLEFFHMTQDARISWERFSEIHQLADEEPTDKKTVTVCSADQSLTFSDVSFQYAGPYSPFVLKNLTLEIPARKTTAVVGVSGSGKTTLIKLLLGFYPPVKGDIRVGPDNLNAVSRRAWRKRCGVVMQDGFIFSDTITNNIAVNSGHVDEKKLNHAVEAANIREMIRSLPLGVDTRIGMEGLALSQGQKQRILIARSIYKNPDYLFFDEATNALDAKNENTIMENLEKIFLGKTVVIVAHRLSTVKNADQIIVLDRGEIIETGTHPDLTAKKGMYYALVKNQLELGA